jgi:hypothetical protein
VPPSEVKKGVEVTAAITPDAGVFFVEGFDGLEEIGEQRLVVDKRVPGVITVQQIVCVCVVCVLCVCVCARVCVCVL